MKRASAAVLLAATAVALAGCASSHAHHAAATRPPNPLTKKIVACERSGKLICDRLAYRRDRAHGEFPLSHHDPTGAQLLTRAQILARYQGKGVTVAAVLMTYGEAQRIAPDLAGASRLVVNPGRKVWVVTTYYDPPRKEVPDGGWGPPGGISNHRRWVRISHDSFILDAATDQETDACQGCAVLPPPRTVKADLRITKDVPCPGNARRVGPAQLRKLKAVTAVMCVDGGRVYPGRGQWEVFLRKVAVSGVAAQQRYFEQRSRPNWPNTGTCTANLVGVASIAFVDAQGRWLVPRTPIDKCHHPLGLPPGQGPLRVDWRVVSVHKIRQLISAPALAAQCDMRWGVELPGGLGRRAAGGSLFPVAPKTLRVCVYRTSAEHQDVGNFVRGFKLERLKTARLLAALTRPGPTARCPVQRTYAVLIAGPGQALSVELGGCFRVARRYPTSGVGSANPSVIRSLLGSG